MVNFEVITRFFLYIIIIVSQLGYNSIQACPAKSDTTILTLRKKIPVYVKTIVGCGDNEALKRQVIDSLKKEGFKIIDSIRAITMTKSFFEDIKARTKGKPPKEQQEIFEYQLNRGDLLQELNIYNYSCLDSMNSFKIEIRPRHKASNPSLSLNFRLPFDSPNKILDVILSLIERK